MVYKPLSGDTTYTYDDLTSVARTSSQPMYLIMADSNPMANAKDVIQYIKDNPGKFTCSHVGDGGNGHLAFASFLMGEGLEATSVPYPGGTADCYTATIGGEVDSCVYGEADLLAREDAHGVINLGSPTTVESLKDVPTLADLGYEGYETNNMAGFFYHKNTPAGAVTAFEKAVKAVLTNENLLPAPPRPVLSPASVLVRKWTNSPQSPLRLPPPSSRQWAETAQLQYGPRDVHPAGRTVKKGSAVCKKRTVLLP